MSNVIDLLRNDFSTFAQRKFNAVDALILCELSYINMPTYVPKYCDNPKNISTVPINELLRIEEYSSMFASGSPKVDKFRRKLLLAVASSPRYRGIRVGEYLERFDESNIDESLEQQFAGVTFDLSNCEGIDNPHTLVVAFRGTDSTLVGWKEDFNMAFRCPVPAQESAAEYLTSVAQRYSKRYSNKNFFNKLFANKLFARFSKSSVDLQNNNPNIIVVGHSKGGNMAAYAAMRLDATSQKLGDLVSKIYSMDGPGFASDVVDTSVFANVSSRIEKVVPQSAFIGLIMDTGVPYKATFADSIGLMQHLGMYWQVKNGDFDYCDCVTPRALAVSKATNEWMMNLPFEERKRRIDSVYSIFSSLGYPTFDEMSSHWSEVVPKLLKIAMHMDSKTYELIRSVMSAFALAGGSSSDKKS
ncbi:triacylglycerol lipase [Gardnerella vaginalis]|uniref:Triacylglycerol lipase n=1 Tax=Gardnerella vaginalis TaxID=2702 RepID=A0A3E1IQP9_GARVA|nr:Mbeg1-like protein [Gardnerella vaginalis]RFD75309.1 triacylglycerol lipase [Gardnerella vaginalis]